MGARTSRTSPGTRYPAVNGRIDGTDVVYNNFYDIGVAVSTERGLMVPVLRDADKLSFAAIETAIADYAKKARENTIAVSDLQGGSFTLTTAVKPSRTSSPVRFSLTSLNSPACCP